MITALTVIGILILLIVTHEFGHFVAAKCFGVRVDEFGIGYPPRAFLLAKFGGTEYTLNWIPFGGFVRLFGEDEAGAHGKGSFADAPHHKQAIILIAGVVANAFVALALFAGALHVGIPRAVEVADSSTRLMVSDVIAGSPANIAGLVPGDMITNVADAKGTRIVDMITPEAVTAFVRAHPGAPITFYYIRAGKNEEVVLRPAQGILKTDASAPAIGIGLVLVSSIGLPWSDAVVQSFPLAWHEFNQTFSGLSIIIKGALRGAPDLNDVVGPVGLVGLVGDAAHNGLGTILVLAGFIGVNLAIINTLPIPALDGGRLLIVLIEAIIRRRVPKLIVQLVNTTGIVLILLLMITVTYHDIARLFA